VSLLSVSQISRISVPYTGGYKGGFRTLIPRAPNPDPSCPRFPCGFPRAVFAGPHRKPTQNVTKRNRLRAMRICEGSLPNGIGLPSGNET
jgi:hypothetical protein